MSQPEQQSGNSSNILALWRRSPVILRAVLTGAVVALAGTVPWTILVNANARYWSFVPWAVPPTAVYLWFFWRYARGEGWPQSTREVRARSLRANQLSGEVWGAALLAGGLGLVTILLILGVVNRMVRLPTQKGEHISHIPLVTLFFWLLIWVLLLPASLKRLRFAATCKALLKGVTGL